MKGTIHGYLLAILLLAPAMAAAQPAGTKITKEQATKAALEQIPGKVTDVTIETKARQECLRRRDPVAGSGREGRPRRHGVRKGYRHRMRWDAILTRFVIGEDSVMRKTICAGLFAVLFAPVMAAAQAPKGLGTEEFGMSPRELVQAIEKTEQLIARCMADQGFQYIAADHNTVRAGMSADKSLPGLSEEEFVSRYGFGVSTFYTGLPPQLSTGYNPARVGLGDRNVQIFRKLSSADQVAYNRALLGDDLSSTFAVALETEDLSRTGGCTRKALTETFKPDQLKASHYNPQDALINKDPRMKAALEFWQREMKKAGFEYGHPDEIEPDLRNRLSALTEGGKLLVSKMSADQKAALRKLQDFERLVAAKGFKMSEDMLKPIEEKIQEELFSRKVQ